jgi:hypothetical protein
MSAIEWPTLGMTRNQLASALKRHSELGLQIDYAHMANTRPDLTLARLLWEKGDAFRVIDESKWPSAPNCRLPPGWPNNGNPWPPGVRVYRLEGLDAWVCVADFGQFPDETCQNPDRNAIQITNYIGLSRNERNLLLLPELAECLLDFWWHPPPEESLLLAL